VKISDNKDTRPTFTS